MRFQPISPDRLACALGPGDLPERPGAAKLGGLVPSSQRPAVPDSPETPIDSPAGEPLVGVVMGSDSDWPTMREAAAALASMGVPFEARVVSAHRTPEDMVAYAQEAEGRGLEVIIAGAGGAAHLPGMIASMTVLPVLGVPVQSRALSGLDSLLSIAQMPGGVPVGTLAIGSAGAKNAGLLAARILGSTRPEIREKLNAYRQSEAERVRAQELK